jgi:MoaA/NifB/PqqE/SkfB family radical SAM enzyme
MRFERLDLQITERCPLQCSHCCVESGPWLSTSMALGDALSYVRQAHAMNPQVLLNFTGGEPFLRFDLLRSIAQEAHALGISHTVITSAIWCTSEERGRQRLRELQDLGLVRVGVSYDAFHAPWVKATQVEDFVAAATELGLSVEVRSVMTRTSPRLTALLGERVGRNPAVVLEDVNVIPVGRAAALPAHELPIIRWSEQNLGCPMSVDLFIRADGTAYPCCIGGKEYEYLLLGDARETSLAELRARAERSLWFRLIANDGFRALEEVVRRYAPEVEFPREHVGVCHLCMLVLGDTPLGERVRLALRQFEADRARTAVGLWHTTRALLGATVAPAD